jgi:hypothetical protein
VLARLILIFAATTLGVGFLFARIIEPLWPAGAMEISIFSNVIQAGMLVWLVGRLSDDPASSLPRAFTVQLPTALVMLILFACAFAPGQLLHGLDHRLALGQPRALVWALMLFDSLVVGMMAAISGGALYVAYSLGATWRGWAPPSSR